MATFEIRDYQPTDTECIIPLTQGYTTVISCDDYPQLSQYKWAVQINESSIYAVTKKTIDGKVYKIYMHRLITNAKKKLIVDHDDGDGLNNRRWNLRVTSYTWNNHNRNKPQGLIPYYGVVQDARRSNARYRSRIHLNGEQIHLGMFATPEEAAKRYDEEALKLYGPYARLNFETDEQKSWRNRPVDNIPF